MNDFPEKENLEQTQAEEEFSTVFSNPAEHRKIVVKKKKLLPKILASVLAVAILTGGTFAVIKLIPEREEEVASSELEKIEVLNLDKDKLKSVTVTNANGSFKLYSKQMVSESSTSSSTESETTVNWYLDGYDEELISSSSVSTVVSEVTSIEAIREVSEKSASDCGLEKPTVKAEIVKEDGSVVSLLVGNSSPDNTGVYIKLSTEDKIYISESSIIDSLSFDALSFASADAIEGIEITDAIKSYAGDDDALSSFDTLTISGVNFPENVVIKPNTDEALSAYAAFITVSPSKRIAENVDGVFGLFKSGVAVSGAYSFKTDVYSRKALGLDKPDLVAEIKLGSFTKSFSFKLQEDGGYAVWYDGAKLISKVDANNIEFINYKTNDYYASWVVLQSINDLSNFTLKTPDKTHSFDIVYDDAEDAEETYVITYNGKKIEAQSFQDFYQQFISLSCSDYTVDKVSGEAAMTVVLSYTDESRNPTTIEFKKASETKYQYSIDGIGMGKVNSSSLNKILREIDKLAEEVTESK